MALLDMVFAPLIRRRDSATNDGWRQFIQEVVVPLVDGDEVDSEIVEGWIERLKLDAEKCNLFSKDPAAGLPEGIKRAQRRLEYMVEKHRERRLLAGQYKQALADDEEFLAISRQVEKLQEQRAKWQRDFDEKHRGTYRRYDELRNGTGQSNAIRQALIASCLDPEILQHERQLQHQLRVVTREIADISKAANEYSEAKRIISCNERELESLQKKVKPMALLTQFDLNETDTRNRIQSLNKRIADMNERAEKLATTFHRREVLEEELRKLQGEVEQLQARKLNEVN
jgi:hypothetical protein